MAEQMRARQVSGVAVKEELPGEGVINRLLPTVNEPPA